MVKQLRHDSASRVNRASRALASLPSPVLRFLAVVRSAFLVGLEPIDYLARHIERRTYLPPLSIRRHAGPLAGLEPSAAEFVAYAKVLCGATPYDSILDMGCGFGMLGLRLKPFLRHPGQYLGVDVDRRAIRWAKRHVVSDNATFEFLYLDVRNDAYNPSGTHRATEFDIPVTPRSFDIIIHKSVFTHLRPDEVRNYLAQTARLLKPGGTCLATFFLLNEVQANLAKDGHNAIDFKFGEPTWRFAVREMPELAVAYSEETLQSWVAAVGLTTKRTHYGSWSGRADGLSYQDVLLLTPS